jgi:peptidyl-prolyl cis-trans isomerase D
VGFFSYLCALKAEINKINIKNRKMATLQKIRNNGKFLIGIVGIALFAFIAEEFVRSLSYTQAESRQRIGKIEGESVNYQDFNELVNEYANVIKFSNGISSLPDEQMAMVRDQVWSTYVNETLLGKECEKLGITVTDAELQSIINAGTNPMLAQTPFRSAQGTFDANALKQFLTQYNEIVNNPSIPAETKEQYSQMYDYWKFIEKSIRKQTFAASFSA